MWFNPIIKTLLKSPLHFFVSKNMMLITFAGQKSGKTYTLPVNYIRDCETLYVTSWKKRTWWRNLRDGNTIGVRIQGKEIAAIPELFESNEDVADLLKTYFQLAPNMAQYFEVGLDPQGKPNPEDIVAASVPIVMVKLSLVK